MAFRIFFICCIFCFTPGVLSGDLIVGFDVLRTRVNGSITLTTDTAILPFLHRCYPLKMGVYHSINETIVPDHLVECHKGGGYRSSCPVQSDHVTWISPRGFRLEGVTGSMAGDYKVYVRCNTTWSTSTNYHVIVYDNPTYPNINKSIGSDNMNLTCLSRSMTMPESAQGGMEYTWRVLEESNGKISELAFLKGQMLIMDPLTYKTCDLLVTCEARDQISMMSSVSALRVSFKEMNNTLYCGYESAAESRCDPEMTPTCSKVAESSLLWVVCFMAGVIVLLIIIILVICQPKKQFTTEEEETGTRV